MSATAQKPSVLVDRLVQTALRAGFCAARAWWFISTPFHEGACVLIWWESNVLLLRQSYQPLWTAPGGGLARGEEPAAAAVREVQEEIALHLSPADIRPRGQIEHEFLCRRDRVHFFDIHMACQPAIYLDNREIVEARWCPAEEALSLDIVPHLRTYLLQRADK